MAMAAGPKRHRAAASGDTDQVPPPDEPDTPADRPDMTVPGRSGRGLGGAAGRLGRRLWAHAAARGGLVFVGASLAAGLSNFVFHLVLSRLLGPQGYGALGALLNVTSVLSVPLGAVSVTVAQSVARRPDPSDTPPLGRLLKLSLVASVVAVGLWLAATPTIDRFFHLHTPDATVVLGLWLIPALPGAVLEGVLFGQRRFRVAGAGQLLATVVRLASGVVLVEVGLGIVGGMAATVASGMVVVAVYAWALRRALLATGRFVPRAGDALLSTAAIGGAAVLTTLDAWLARHFLPAHSAGLFVAAATAGNIALFLPGAITMVYFPRLAASGGRGPEARQALARVTGLVAAVGLGAVGVMALVPRLVVDVLFGSAFAHASVALATVALADAGIAVASCFVYYQVARRSPLALAAWPTAVGALVLAALFHGSIEVLALDMVAASAALVVGLGVPSLVGALRSLADDTASLPRQALLLEPAELDLTVVVPCRNVGAERLAGHLTRICDTLHRAGVAFEVVPVSDGSTDGSEAAFDRLPGELVRPIVWSDNRGKGEALRIGLARGRGRYLGFIDGDGDIPADGLARFVAAVRRQQPEVVVGSKRHRDAQVVYPPLRRMYSAGYQCLTRLLFGLRVRDTQTGIKLVRRDVVAEVLPRLVEKRFAFDLELLAVAHRLGYRQVAELPVVIGERFSSTISARSVWRMLQDTLATFWRLRVLRFYDPPLTEPSVANQAAAVLGADVGAGSLVQVVAPATAGSPPPLGEAGLGAAAGVLAPPVLVGPAAPGLSAVAGAGDLAEAVASGPRLRILVCNWRDLAHPHAGGAEVYTHRVAAAWAAAGHQVTWFCAEVAGRPSMEHLDGITVVRRGSRHSVYRQARLFYQRQGRGRFDLVVDEVNTRPFEAARWASGTPVVALVHQVAREVWFQELAWPVALAGRFLVEPRWLRQMRRVPVLTVSESSRRSLARFGIEDITIVAEGVDPVARPPVERASVPTVVFVGRLARNKRPDHVVAAFRLLRRQVPDSRLWMIGDGPMAGVLRRDLPDGVELLGRVSEAEKQRRLAEAHCLVATSVREGWGLTVTEAAQLGTPAVAYDVDGLRDSVAASGGMLVAPHPEALAATLAEQLPGWMAGGLPPVEAGGVLPWPAVADELLAQAAARTAARRRTAVVGEDVAMAWRRAMVPLAAVCDRRAWSVAGIAALVAVAPLSEVRAGTWADVVAGVAVACLAVAVLGTWADAVRWPLPPLSAHRAGDGGARRGRSAAVRRWAPLVAVGVLVAAAVQPWLAGASGAMGGRLPAVGSAWTRQLALAFSPGARGADGALAAVLQLPVDAVGSLLHLAGASAALDERLWLTAMLVGVTLSMGGLLLALGLESAAAAVGALVYALSPYVLAMSGLNLAYLAAMVLVPGLVAWVVLAARAKRLSSGRLVWLVVAAMGLGLVAESPPLVLACGAALVGAVALVGWLDGRGGLLTALRRTAVGVGVLAVAGAFWAVPYGWELASTSMVSAAAQRRWGWAADRSTLVNTLWLNSAWNWHDPALYPFAGDFHHFPLVLWRYAVPVVAFAVLGVAGLRARTSHDQQRLRLLVAAAAVALVVVVLATGTRAPGAPLFGLVTAVPFGWLVEDPGRFLFVAGAAYAVLVAVLVDQRGRGAAVAAAAASPAVAQSAPGRRLVPVGLALALVAPAYPLVTGAVPARVGAVRVPAAVSCRRGLGLAGCVASGGQQRGGASNDGGRRLTGRPAPPPEQGSLRR